jgi:hypothetical protein
LFCLSIISALNPGTGTVQQQDHVFSKLDRRSVVPAGFSVSHSLIWTRPAPGDPAKPIRRRPAAGSPAVAARNGIKRQLPFVDYRGRRRLNSYGKLTVPNGAKPSGVRFATVWDRKRGPSISRMEGRSHASHRTFVRALPNRKVHSRQEIDGLNLGPPVLRAECPPRTPRSRDR